MVDETLKKRFFKKRLKKRVEELESFTTRIKEAQDEHFETSCKTRVEILERIAALETELKELSLTVENGFDDGKPKKSPQQLMNEWFTGVEE